MHRSMLSKFRLYGIIPVLVGEKCKPFSQRGKFDRFLEPHSSSSFSSSVGGTPRMFFESKARFGVLWLPSARVSGWSPGEMTTKGESVLCHDCDLIAHRIYFADGHVSNSCQQQCSSHHMVRRDAMGYVLEKRMHKAFVNARASFETDYCGRHGGTVCSFSLNAVAQHQEWYIVKPANSPPSGGLGDLRLRPASPAVSHRGTIRASFDHRDVPTGGAKCHPRVGGQVVVRWDKGEDGAVLSVGSVVGGIILFLLASAFRRWKVADDSLQPSQSRLDDMFKLALALYEAKPREHGRERFLSRAVWARKLD